MTSPVITCPGGARQATGRVARKAVPNLVLQGIIPAVCFLVGRRMWGLSGAVCLALSWNGSYQAVRWVRGKPLSGLLLVGLIELILRAAVALAFRSAQMFFVAPIVATAVTGGIYVVSGLMSRPLISRVAAELIPDSVLDVRHPGAQILLRRVSVVYGTEQLLVALLSAAMLLNLPTTTYVAVHGVVSCLVLVAAVACVAPFFRNGLRAVGRNARCPLPQAA
jgi:hypothetical protein